MVLKNSQVTSIIAVATPVVKEAREGVLEDCGEGGKYKAEVSPKYNLFI